MKRKGVSIFTLWEKAAKAKKTASTSTPNDPSVEIERNRQLAPVHEQDDGEENNEALQLVQAQNDGEANDEAPRPDRSPPAPIVEDYATDEEGEVRADLEALEHDPGKRIPISRYDVNDQDRVRRRYFELGPCQPKNHAFKSRDISGHPRRFCSVWFKEYKWLEYSVENDAAFCFVCYLFKDRTKCPGGDRFVNGGWRNWNLKARLKRHIGGVTSAHAKAQEKYDRFTRPTPNDPSVEIESNMQLALVQEQDDGKKNNEALQLVQAHSDGEANDEAPWPDRFPPAPTVEDYATDEEGEVRGDLEALEHDPGKRIPISTYDVNVQDRVRRRYIELGPCQPKNHDFKTRDISGHPRRFCSIWFEEYKWLEYSVEKDAAFCFVCYLFKDRTKCPGGDRFVNGGWRNWNLKARLKKHIGGVTSAHAKAQEKYDMFTTPTTSIRKFFNQVKDDDIINPFQKGDRGVTL